jgi:DNA-binding beta-propeller fold protein YncE
VAAVIGIGVVVWWMQRSPEAGNGPPPPLLTTVIEQPLAGAAGLTPTPWFQPSDIEVVDGSIYVLDAGNNRVLRLDDNGGIQEVLCEAGDCAFLLDAPEALAVTDDGIWVTNTNKGEVNLIRSSNEVAATLEMPAGDADPRPSGLALGADGTLYVSDAANGWVVRFDPQGEASFVGPPDEAYAFAGPQGLALDGAGNLYVAERDLGRVQKMSPQGRPLTFFAMVPENPDISAPSDVALTTDGEFVLMADQRRAIVHVFSASAGYRGIAGLLDATRIDSPSAIRDPQAIAFADDALYVLDGRRGIEVFSWDRDYWS